MKKKSVRSKKARKPRKPYLKDYEWACVSWYHGVTVLKSFVKIAPRKSGSVASFLDAKDCRSLGERLIKAADYLEARER
jgi:hypothetical protein